MKALENVIIRGVSRGWSGIFPDLTMSQLDIFQHQVIETPKMDGFFGSEHGNLHWQQVIGCGGYESLYRLNTHQFAGFHSNFTLLDNEDDEYERLRRLELLHRQERTENGYPVYIGKYVNDFVEIISNENYDYIWDALRELERDTGIEFTVVTISSISDYDTSKKHNFEGFCTELFNTWGIGKKEEDNDGVMLLVADEDQVLRIELGAGYPSFMDSKMKSVVSNKIVPHFKAGDMNSGIRAGVDEIIKQITTSEEEESHEDEKEYLKVSEYAIALLIAIFVFFMWIYVLEPPKNGEKEKSSGYDYDYDDDDNDSSSSSDDYDDDYDSDFGGGDSDGGGASGSW